MNLTPLEKGEREFKHILKLKILFSLNGRNNSPKIENFDRKSEILHVFFRFL